MSLLSFDEPLFPARVSVKAVMRRAAYRLAYVARDDVVVFHVIGEHEAAYRDAERRA